MSDSEFGGVPHWREGLFLRQHHLQAQQRFLLEGFQRTRQLPFVHNYGVIEARLLADRLENYLVEFEFLHAVTPSGLEVYFKSLAGGGSRGNLDLEARGIKAEYMRNSDFIISLGVPNWQKGTSNAVGLGEVADRRSKVRFQVTEQECADENSGKDTQPLEMRKIRGSLFLPGEDTTGWDVLPLRKVIANLQGERGRPVEDPQYAPPCLVMGGDEGLYLLVEELMQNVMAHRSGLYKILAAANASVDAREEQRLRFRTLNRFASRFSGWLARSNAGSAEGKLESPLRRLPPFLVYLALSELIGELACFYLNQDWAGDASVPYQHDNPYRCFKDLNDKLRDMLPLSRAQPLRVRFTALPNRQVLVANLTEEHFTRPIGYFLAIETALNPGEFRNLIIDRTGFKVMPGTRWDQQVFGVPLVEQGYTVSLPQPPRGNLHYFRLETTQNPPIWTGIRRDAAIALVSTNGAFTKLNNANLELYMTVPNQ